MINDAYYITYIIIDCMKWLMSDMLAYKNKIIIKKT